MSRDDQFSSQDFQQVARHLFDLVQDSMLLCTDCTLSSMGRVRKNSDFCLYLSNVCPQQQMTRLSLACGLRLSALSTRDALIRLAKESTKLCSSKSSRCIRLAMQQHKLSMRPTGQDYCCTSIAGDISFADSLTDSHGSGMTFVPLG